MIALKAPDPSKELHLNEDAFVKFYMLTTCIHLHNRATVDLLLSISLAGDPEMYPSICRRSSRPAD